MTDYYKIQNLEFLAQLKELLGERELQKFLDGKNIMDCLQDKNLIGIIDE